MDYGGGGKDQGGRILSFDDLVQVNNLSFQEETLATKNKEPCKRMSSVEEMVANLIVNQQAIAKLFQ